MIPQSTGRYEASMERKCIYGCFILTLKLNMFQVIDASRDVEDVHKDVAEHALNTVNNVQDLPLGELWK